MARLDNRRMLIFMVGWEYYYLFGMKGTSSELLFSQTRRLTVELRDLKTIGISFLKWWLVRSLTDLELPDWVGKFRITPGYPKRVCKSTYWGVGCRQKNGQTKVELGTLPTLTDLKISSPPKSVNAPVKNSNWVVQPSNYWKLPYTRQIVVRWIYTSACVARLSFYW